MDYSASRWSVRVDERSALKRSSSIGPVMSRCAMTAERINSRLDTGSPRAMPADEDLDAASDSIGDRTKMLRNEVRRKAPG